MKSIASKDKLKYYAGSGEVRLDALTFSGLLLQTLAGVLLVGGLLVGVNRTRNRAGLRLFLKVKDPDERFKIGSPPFDAAPIEELHGALTEKPGE